MLKIDRKVSLIVTLVLAIVAGGAMVFFAIYMPTYLKKLMDVLVAGGAHEAFNVYEQVLLYVSAYLALVLAAAWLVLVFMLLRLVFRKQIFTKTAVALLRGISWCLLFIGVIFCAVSFATLISLLIGFVSLFFALCIRVIKNVLEEAVAIKEENDLTV